MIRVLVGVLLFVTGLTTATAIAAASRRWPLIPILWIETGVSVVILFSALQFIGPRIRVSFRQNVTVLLYGASITFLGVSGAQRDQGPRGVFLEIAVITAFVASITTLVANVLARNRRRISSRRGH